MISRVLLASALAVVATAAYLRGTGSILYDSQSAKEKFDYLYSNIVADNTPADWPSTIGFNPYATLAGLFLESMKPTVELISDEFPDGRYKLIHSVGGAASVKVDWTDAASQYTGLFRGANYGLIRMASATEPSEGGGKKSEESGFVPGLGIKFLRDGQPSGNIFFLHTLTPQIGSWNFFKSEQSNHLSANGLGTAESLLFKKFTTSGSDWPNMVGLSDLARYGEDGTVFGDDTISFPFQLILKPDAGVLNGFPDEYEKPLIEQLRSIQSGTTLYNIYAKKTYDSAPELIGNLVTTSAIDSSVYADSKLFLKHQMMEEDFPFQADFIAACPEQDSCPVCPTDISC